MKARDEIARLREMLSSAQRERDFEYQVARAIAQMNSDAAYRNMQLSRRIDSAICMLVEGPVAIGGMEARECAIRILRGLDEATEHWEGL